MIVVNQRVFAMTVRRVLRMVDGFLACQPQDALTTDGNGLMTWREIRQHIAAASKLQVKRDDRP